MLLTKLIKVSDDLKKHGQGELHSLFVEAMSGIKNVAALKGQDISELEFWLKKEIGDNPKYLANKIGFYDEESGRHDEGRFRTKQKPVEFADRFVRGPDGYWYLQDVENVSVRKNKGQKNLVVYDDSRDFGADIPGLELIDMRNGA